MKYDPNEAISCWPQGEYAASLKKCEEKQSKSSGNDMYEITVECYDGSKSMQIRDWFVNPSTLWKMKRLAIALGKRDEFDRGEFDPGQHIGANFTVALTAEENGEYGDQNRINAYMPKEKRQLEAALSGTPDHSPVKEEDIPFD